MTCASALNMTSQMVRQPSTSWAITSISDLRNDIIDNASFGTSCTDMVDFAASFANNRAFINETGTVDLLQFDGLFSGESQAGDHIDFTVVTLPGVTNVGFIRVIFGLENSIAEVQNFLTIPNPIVFGVITGLSITQGTYVGAGFGNFTAPAFFVESYVQTINFYAYVGCLVPACRANASLDGHQQNRVRMTNYEFNLNPKIYKVK